jgi:hypothetical protein
MEANRNTGIKRRTLMSWYRTLSQLLLVSLIAAARTDLLAAQEEETKIEKAMQARIANVDAGFVAPKKADSKLERYKTPLLSFSDPTREEIDGKLYLWHSDSAPVALLSLTYYGNLWAYEHVTLSDDSIQFTYEEDWKWAPQANTRMWIRLKAAVSEKANVRKIQMRAALRQFNGKESIPGNQIELRLVPRPLYSYSDEDAGILQGGLFAFSYGTNPEVIARIEARREETDEEASWYVSFARLSSAEVKVSRDEEVIWEVPIIRRGDSRADYWANGVPITEPDLVNETK